MNKNLAQWKMETEVAPLFLVASPKGLKLIGWRQDISVNILESLDSNLPEVKILAEARRQLQEYFSGSRKIFDLPLDVDGTDFQMQVWSELKKVPYGVTCSYLDIAKKIKNEKAVRAVGAANGKNPLSIVVPCHRVIGSNGTLTGYAGGLKMKTQLIGLEKNHS